MLKTILVPTDGSPLAERAFPYATALAKAADAKVVLMRAIESIGADTVGDPAVDALRQLDTDIERLRAAGVVVEPNLRRLYLKPLGESILECATDQEADLIVMATHGRGGIRRFVYGSVADAILRSARVPVMLVPAAGARTWPTERPPRILVPLDRSELSEAALGPATELADQLKAALLLVHVVAIPTYPLADGYGYAMYDLDPELADATAELEQTAERLRADGRTVQTKVTIGFPMAAISEIAASQEADLIVMATHGRGGLARLVLGSVATATLQRAGLPVLLVRPAALGSAAAEARPEASEDAVAPPGASGPSVAITLNPAEIVLIERGLSDLLYLPARDPGVAKSAQALLTRLKEAEAALLTGAEVSSVG